MCCFRLHFSDFNVSKNVKKIKKNLLQFTFEKNNLLCKKREKNNLSRGKIPAPLRISNGPSLNIFFLELIIVVFFDVVLCEDVVL